MLTHQKIFHQNKANHDFLNLNEYLQVNKNIENTRLDIMYKNLNMNLNTNMIN